MKEDIKNFRESDSRADGKNPGEIAAMACKELISDLCGNLTKAGIYVHENRIYPSPSSTTVY